MQPQEAVSEVAVKETESQRQEPENERSRQETKTERETVAGLDQAPRGENEDGGPREHGLLPSPGETVPEAFRHVSPRQAVVGSGEVPDSGRRIEGRRSQGAPGPGELPKYGQIGGCLDGGPSRDDDRTGRRGRDY